MKFKVENVSAGLWYFGLFMAVVSTLMYVAFGLKFEATPTTYNGVQFILNFNALSLLLIFLFFYKEHCILINNFRSVRAMMRERTPSEDDIPQIDWGLK